MFLTPFLPDDRNPLSGLGFGVGASGGNVDGHGRFRLRSTVGQNTFFTFASGVTGPGHRTRLAPRPTTTWVLSDCLAEYTLTEEGLQKTSVRRDIAFRAWQVQASYILTGEKKGFTSPTPKRSFDPRNDGWGAVELAVRVGDFAAEPASIQLR